MTPSPQPPADEVARFRLPVDLDVVVYLLHAIAKAYPCCRLGPQMEVDGTKWATVVAEEAT